jgi:hypothetical protein
MGFDYFGSRFKLILFPYEYLRVVALVDIGSTIRDAL